MERTNRLWLALPYYFFSKPSIKIILRDSKGDRLILLYMQLLCMSIQNEGEVVYSPTCRSFTLYTLAVSLEGNFSVEELEKLLPILKDRSLIDYEEPEDPKQFKLLIKIIDFDTDFPLTREAIAVEREERKSESSSNGIHKEHHPFTIQLIDNGYLTRFDNNLSDYDDYFKEMTSKFSKFLTIQRMSEGIDEIYSRFLQSETKINSKIKWFKECYSNLIHGWRKIQVTGEKEKTSFDNVSLDELIRELQGE